MILKRAWCAVFEYVQSELTYSSSVPQTQPVPDVQQKPPPTTSSFAPPSPDLADHQFYRCPDPQFVAQQQQRERVYSFIRVPMSLKKFMLFGYWLCVDTFLTMFTFLPIRIVFCVFNLLTRIPGYFFKNWERMVTPAQRCDFLRGIVIIFCSAIVGQLDISVFYHLIRSQSIIKLYIFFNMLEIAEKLMTSVGQDIMDALFITANEQTYPKSRSRYLMLSFHVALAIIYSCIHTVILMLQAVTLNVAFNSQNKSLLTVMMSNNFVEIKSNVFRKYSKNNLYQVACADARERFHLVVFMAIVAARNLAQFHWSLDHFMALLPDMILVLTAETSSEVYVELRTSLARHVLTASVVSGGADRQDTVANRTGLSLVPLSCLVIIVGMQVLKSADLSGPDPLYLALMVVGVFMLKSVLGYLVLCIARTIVVQAQQLATANIAHSHVNGRLVLGYGHTGRKNRSYSVEDVQFEASKAEANMASLPPLPSSKPANVTSSSLKELISKNNSENEQPSNVSAPKALPQLMALKKSWGLNDLRRTRSISDLSTIYETSQLNIAELTSNKGESRLACRKFLFTPSAAATCSTASANLTNSGDHCPVKSSTKLD